LQTDRVADRHIHCMQTRLRAGIWKASRQARVSRRHAIWQAKRVADRRSALASRQVGMPAHRVQADRVAGRQADLQADRGAGRHLDGR
jgi:hypothetical protein